MASEETGTVLNRLQGIVKWSLIGGALLAAAVTYGIGALIGIAISG